MAMGVDAPLLFALAGGVLLLGLLSPSVRMPRMACLSPTSRNAGINHLDPVNTADQEVCAVERNDVCRLNGP
jgi:hypothetical protein